MKAKKITLSMTVEILSIESIPSLVMEAITRIKSEDVKF